MDGATCYGLLRSVDLDPHHMAVALEGMSNAFLFHWMEQPDSSPPEDRPALIMDMFLAGTIVLIYFAIAVVGTLLSDILLAWLDPRIRMEES